LYGCPTISLAGSRVSISEEKRDPLDGHGQQWTEENLSAIRRLGCGSR
jgi:hypothetical protein